MGTEVSKVSQEGFEFDETALSEFCGRKKDLNEIVKLITRKNVKTLCVHGAKSIGKTRVINHVLMDENLKCFKLIAHVDCSLFSEDFVDKYFIQFLEEFYESLGLESSLDPCGACELCRQKSGCTKLLKELTLALKKVTKPTLICFDNADLLLNSSFKSQFLDFIKTVTEKRKNIKILVGSTVRFHLTSKVKETYLVDKMDKEDLKKLIVQILKPDEEDGNDYLSSMRIQDRWLEAVAILTDGMPKCAELLGTILREDDYLIEPIEIVQLLLTNFIQTLNPDLFAKEDRPTAKYREELEKFNEISEAYQERWLYEIAETMEDSEITPEEALKAVQDDGSQVAKGTFKMDGLRKMMDNNILQKREKTSVALSMQRLYQHLLNLLKDNDDDGLNLKTYIGEHSLALIKEDARRIDLNLDQAGPLNAVKIERVLNRKDQRLNREDSGRSSGEEHEDDSGNDSNDSIEDIEQGMNELTVCPCREEINGHGLHSAYNRVDSTSGPYAMSFKPNDVGSHNVNGNIDKAAVQLNNPAAHVKDLIEDDENDKGERNLELAELDPENDFLKGLTNGVEARHVDTGEYILSNTYPTTKLRKGLQPEENSDDTKLKRERTSSTNQIYVTPVHRLSSEEYEKSIENNYISTSEARNLRHDRESPTNHDKKTCARYSGSSTDSGELKLDFETKTIAGED